MSSKLTMLVICSTLTLLITFVSAQSDMQPMPEPTVVYTCGDNFQPSDLAFDGQGVLYAMEAQRPNKPLEIYNFSNTTCLPVPLNFEPESSAIATDSEGNKYMCAVFGSGAGT
jgi:hypothetical protein